MATNVNTLEYKPVFFHYDSISFQWTCAWPCGNMSKTPMNHTMQDYVRSPCPVDCPAISIDLLRATLCMSSRSIRSNIFLSKPDFI